jgi:hypothetical protein
LLVTDLRPSAAQIIWKEEYDATSKSRFRGLGREITPLYLATHFLIERSREALLWSFLVARSDLDHDGYYSLEERRQLLHELRSNSTSFYFESQYPIQSILTPHIPTGLATTQKFSFMDGYALTSGVEHQWPIFDASAFDPTNSTQGTLIDQRDIACRQSIVTCFGEHFGTDLSPTLFKSSDIMKRVAFEMPNCGDCIILALKAKDGSRKGLEHFLPKTDAFEGEEMKEEEQDNEEDNGRGEEDDDDTIRSPWQVLSLSKDSSDIEYALPAPLAASTYFSKEKRIKIYTQQLRRYAVALLFRYRYTIGESTLLVCQMTTASQVKSSIASIDKQFAIASRSAKSYRSPVTFLTLNDDIQNSFASQQINSVLAKYFELSWGKIKLPFEL